MNIDFTRMSPLHGVSSVEAENKGLPAGGAYGNGVKPLFGEALTVREKEIFSLEGLDAADVDEIEKELVRDDALGKLMSSHLNWEPPGMPQFV